VPRHAAPAVRHPGDLLVRLGATVFAVGVDLLALLLPVGFGLALLGLFRSARSHE
jgi:hypothetical protein